MELLLIHTVHLEQQNFSLTKSPLSYLPAPWLSTAWTKMKTKFVHSYTHWCKLDFRADVYGNPVLPDITLTQNANKIENKNIMVIHLKTNFLPYMKQIRQGIAKILPYQKFYTMFCPLINMREIGTKTIGSIYLIWYMYTLSLRRNWELVSELSSLSSHVPPIPNVSWSPANLLKCWAAKSKGHISSIW